MTQENSCPTCPRGIFIPGLQPKMSHFMGKVQKWLIKHKLGDAAEQISCQMKTACSGGKHTCLHPGWKRRRKIPLQTPFPARTHTRLSQELPRIRISCWWGLQSLLVPSQPAQHSSFSSGSHNAWKSLRAGIKLQKASAALSEIAPGGKGTAW